MRNAEQLFLRVVFVFALPKAVGPFSEQRRSAGQFAVSGNDAVKFRAIEKVIVHFVGNFGAEIQRAEKTIVEPASRGVVPEDSVSVAGQEDWNADIGVVL